MHLTAENPSLPSGGLLLRDGIQGTAYAMASQEFLSGSRISNVIIDYASGVSYALHVQVALDLNGLLMRHNWPSSATLRLVVPSEGQSTLSGSRFIQNRHSDFDLEIESDLWMRNNAWLFNSAPTTHVFSVVNVATEPWPLCLDVADEPQCVGADFLP